MNGWAEVRLPAEQFVSLKSKNANNLTLTAHHNWSISQH